MDRWTDGVRRVQPTRCDVSQFICFSKMLYMFQTVFPSVIRSSKLHTQRQVFVTPILLPGVSLAGMEHPGQASSIPDAVCAVLSS